MSEALCVEHLCVTLSGRLVVNEVSFVAKWGRILSILGPNGAGKSSMVKAAAGILPYKGNVFVSGERMAGKEPSARALRVGYMPQQSQLRSALSVREVVGQGRHSHAHGTVHWRTNSVDRSAVEGALDRVELTHLASRAFTTLSYGERQRVILARTLATGARVLLLDEPTSALDIGHALRLHRLLRFLADEGYCIAMIVHAMDQALEHSDDALLLDHGRIVQHGPVQDIIAQGGSVERVYGVRLIPNGALGFALQKNAPSGDSDS